MRTLSRRLLVAASILLVLVVTYLAFAPGPTTRAGDAELDAAKRTAVVTELAAETAATQQRAQTTSAPPSASASADTEADFTPVEGVDHWQRGRQRFWAGDYAAAQVELERAVRQRPGTYYPHYLLGLTYYRLGNLERAEREYVSAKEIDGDQPEALVNLARLFMDVEAFDEALEVAQQATDVAPAHAAAWNQLGRAQLALGDQEAAVASFQEACRLDEENAYAWNNLGYTYIMMGAFAEALGPLEKAVALADGIAFVHNNLGVVLERLGRLADAHRAFARAAEIDPDHPHARRSAERLAAFAGSDDDREVVLQPTSVGEGETVARALEPASRADEAPGAERPAAATAAEDEVAANSRME